MPRNGLAVVTGASSGLGKIYAQRLAQRGYDLVLVARNALQMQQLAGDLLSRFGATCEVVPADLGRNEDLVIVADRLRADTDIGVLVNSAGLAAGGRSSDVDFEKLVHMLNVNVVALATLCSAVSAGMVQNGSGAIINISSATAFMDAPGAAAYAASKAFVLNFTRSLDLELRPKGVQVQAVVPGYTRTPMLGDARHISEQMLMEPDALVDAALVGFDRGELITIPSLSDPQLLDALERARSDLIPHLSKQRPAERYLSAAV